MNSDREFGKCSRCGLCLSVCPTYSMTVREQYSPRGRLALMQMGEEGKEIPSVAEYVSSCLRCALCEEVCPTGVPYGSLVRRFINRVLAPDETMQVEKLGNSINIGGCDPARAVVFELMIDAWRANEVSDDVVSEGNFTTSIPASSTSELKATLLMAGAILSRHFAHIVSKATRALETEGYIVFRSPAADALSLPWLENGMLSVFERLATRVRTEIENFGVKSIVVLDPTLMDSFAGALVAPLIKKWRLDEQQDSLQSVFEIPGIKMFDLETLVETLPPTVAIDRTLHAADALYRAAIKRRGAASIVTPPMMLRGAGAPPLLDLSATHFLDQLIMAKSVWAQSLPASLTTIDSYTLLRVPSASHVLQD